MREAEVAVQQAGRWKRRAGLLVLVAGLVAVPQAVAGAAEQGTPVHAAIVNGEATTHDAWPYAVGVLATAVQDPFQALFCTGSAVADQWVLTAAHCVDAAPAGGIDVFAGSEDLRSPAGQRIHADGVVVHPGWDAAAAVDDLALVHTSTSLGVPIVQLPGGGVQAVGDDAWTAGWGCGLSSSSGCLGYPTVLREAYTPVNDDASCSVFLRQLAWSFDEPTQLCVGYVSQYGLAPGACDGDSGGPLVGLDASGRDVLLGITSRGGRPCGYAVGIDTEVAAFADWVRTTAGITPPAPLAPPAPPVSTPAAPVPPACPAGGDGYWMLGADGATYAFGAAPALGGGQVPTGGRAVDLVATPSGCGFWSVDAGGLVVAHGDAPAMDGATGQLLPGERISGLASTATGKGLWLFSTFGRVFTRGDAPFFGDLAGQPLNGPVLRGVPTGTGEGYWMVGADGGVFSFGDAQFYGSTGGITLNRPVMSITSSPSGKGYWLVADDGGIFAFGDAPFLGSTGAVHLNQPVVGMIAYGDGYLMVAADGGIFAFSSRPFLGSLGGQAIPAPITAVATRFRPRPPVEVPAP